MRMSYADVRIFLREYILYIMMYKCKVRNRSVRNEKKGSPHDLPFSYIIIYKTTFFKPNCLEIFLPFANLILTIDYAKFLA